MSENTIECAKCGTRYRILKEVRGPSVACKKCGAMIELAPAPQPAPRAGAKPPPSYAPHPYAPHAAHAPQRHRRRAAAGAGQQPLAVYILIGIGGIAGLVGLYSLFPETRAPSFGQAPKEQPTPAPTKPANKYVAAPPLAPAPVERPALALGALEGAKIVHPPQKLEHLADTSADARTRIDDALAKLLDISNPRVGTAASQELVQLGKPAIPRVLSAWVDLGMGDDKDTIRANLLDQVLRQITRLGSKYRPQGSTPAEVRERERARDAWFQWWGEVGERFGAAQPPSGG